MPLASKPIPDPGDVPLYTVALRAYLQLLHSRPILTKALSRLCFTGPLSHYFYLFLEQLVPSSVPLAGLRRLLLDRLIVAPAFLLLFFIVMNFLEGKDLNTLNRKLKDSYWSALKMNWKVWTPFQFINVNYVPVQFRVLFANFVAFFWYTYLASTRK
ncbi:peroxisomal membrane protein 2 isoform X2 [Mixophyes fleayi]|uniref:peroxisomal membrane protein 2 isoform X2 n=1 Tax=Mixophyes fleayi TaxID=3061075 RepID=UPI003F4D9848